MRDNNGNAKRGRVPARKQSLWLVFALAFGGASVACESESPAAAPAPAVVHNYVLQVQGMHCDACSDAITAKVSTMPGVQEVSVDHESGRAQVQVKGDETKGPALIEAIDKLGFEAAITSPDAAKPQS